jgi:16S rRNA (cytosine967-C5)-methyltransferase
MIQARNIASNVLYRSQSGKHTLDQLLSQADQQVQRLNRADRALLHAIVYGVLRWQARLDWVIDHLTLRPGKKIDPLVRVILRMGLFQMHYLERIPTSAAVNTSVELTKKKRRKWASGFVNSVLRRAADTGKEIPWPDRGSDPIDFLSTFYAFPQWLICRWVGHWGVDETEALCKSINTIPPITVRTNTLRVDRQQLLEQIQTEAKEISFTAHSPEGISFSSVRHPIAHWKAFQKGWFQVQSEAAQCIAHLLDVSSGHRVWDACAGLGTKTAHLAQLMEDKGRILATDLSANKLGDLKVEMRRLGITIVEPLQLDLAHPPAHWHRGSYDRILVDAPCTGLGVLQKNPDGKWLGNPAMIQHNSRRQLTLLDNAAIHLKPKGIMVYAVCSIEPEENEQVIQGFLQKHSEFVIEHPKLDQVMNGKELLTSEGFVKTSPHKHQMDGFFAAALKKRG